MTEVFRRKAFRYGEDVAFRLPKSYGIKPGTKFELQKHALGITIRILSESGDDALQDSVA